MSPSTSTAVAPAPAVAGPSTVPTNAGAATATTADVAMTAAIDRTAARRCGWRGDGGVTAEQHGSAG